MVRWYDWIVAFMAADFLLNFFALAVFGDTIWIQLGGGVMVVMILDIWEDFYCKIRRNMESRR